MRDVYRESHDPAAAYAASHFTGSTPRRYDHIYASPDLKARRCVYHSGWLEGGLSDHAAVEADLEPAVDAA